MTDMDNAAAAHLYADYASASRLQICEVQPLLPAIELRCNCSMYILTVSVRLHVFANSYYSD